MVFNLPAVQLGVTIFAKKIVEMVLNLPALELGVKIFAKHFGDGLPPTSSRA